MEEQELVYDRMGNRHTGYGLKWPIVGRLFVPDVREVVLDSFSSPEKVEHLQIRQHVLRCEHLWGIQETVLYAVKNWIYGTF